MLVPLPAALDQPVVLRMTGDGGPELVPRALFASLVTDPGDVLDPFESFHVVGARIDLCDRSTTEPCDPAADGMLRLVLQPLAGTPPTASDVALHAFYPIPNGELASVVQDLRVLAGIQDLPTATQLTVNPGLANNFSGYAPRMKLLVTRFASADRLFRLTLFAQDARTAAVNWSLRGVVRDGAGFVPIAIPDVGASEQHVLLLGPDTTYDTNPLANLPTGFSTALYSDAFAAADATARTFALESLAVVQNPTRHTPDTVQCVSCHVATFLLDHRIAAAGIDPQQVAGRYTSTSFDLSTSAGISRTNNRSLRALGWLGREPAISQRVVNETANVLDELERRFPAP